MKQKETDWVGNELFKQSINATASSLENQLIAQEIERRRREYRYFIARIKDAKSSQKTVEEK